MQVERHPVRLVNNVGYVFTFKSTKMYGDWFGTWYDVEVIAVARSHEEFHSIKCLSNPSVIDVVNAAYNAKVYTCPKEWWWFTSKPRKLVLRKINGFYE